MKKNIFTVLILALTVINVVLTAVLFFVMLPTFQKTNTLLTDVAAVLNLDLDADSEAGADADVTLSDMEPIAVAWESQQTYNLKSDGSGKEHFAMMKGYTLYLNKKSEDFSEIQGRLSTDHAQIDGILSAVISKHTAEEATQDVIIKESLEEINKLLDSKIAVQLVLDGYVKQ